MIIGYQGDIYSNNEYVAKQLFPNEKLVPLITSENVCKALKDGTIDYGIMALWNTIGKNVNETQNILESNDLILTKIYDIPIRHYLFSKARSLNEIKEVWSHPQALKQTQEWRKEHIPFAKEVEVDEQAKAATKISQSGRTDVAVLCRIEAGDACRLNQLSDGISDMQNNRTVFGVFKKPI